MLILRSERTDEGNQRKNSRYILKWPVGEIVFPATEVLHLCLDWDDAYAFMKSRIRPDDVQGVSELCEAV